MFAFFQRVLMNAGFWLVEPRRIFQRVLLTVHAVQCLFFPSIQAAESDVEALEIIDLLPESYNRSMAEEELRTLLKARRTQLYFQMVKLDKEILENLRWTAPYTTGTACVREAPELRRLLSEIRITRPPRDDSELLPLFAEQARVQLQLNQPGPALRSIQEALSRLRCLEEPVKTPFLFQLFWMEAIAHTQLKDGIELSAFADALNLMPANSPEKDYGKSVRTTLQSARKAWQKVEWVDIDAGALRGQLFLDGVEIAPGAQTRPGRHLLQLLGPEQREGQPRPLRSWLITVPRQRTVELEELLEVEEKAFPSQEGVQQQLAGNLRAMRLEPYQAEVLEQTLRQQERLVMAFALEAPGARRVVLRAYRVSQGLIDGSELKVFMEKGKREKGKREEGRTSDVREHSSERIPQLERQSPGPAVLVGASGRRWVGEVAQYRENQVGLTPTIEVDWPMGEWLLMGRLGAGLRPPLPAQYQHPCTSESPVEDTFSTDPCNHQRGSASVQLGGGYPLSVAGQLWFIPAAVLDATWLPNLVAPPHAPANTASTLVDMLLLAPTGKLELRKGWNHDRLQLSLGVTAGLHLSHEPERWYVLPSLSTWLAFGVGNF